MKQALLKKSKFTQYLLQWNREMNTRLMPWKGEKDPYKIWLSEIILQQTRVAQGLQYYEKFIQIFPDIDRLAKASDEKVYKLWEGLGYYTRCNNLIETARFISNEKKGKFPDSYEEILKLKGIGSYTASAIASFAYDLPHAVVDANVYRVLARVFGIQKAMDSTEGKMFFSTLAAELLDKNQPAVYNQALMDFGAVVCKPVAPLCNQCVFKNSCIAFATDKIDELPVKEKKLNIKTRWFYYLVTEYNQKLFIRQRNTKDIWKNLYEFYLLESTEDATIDGILKIAEKKNLIQKRFYQVDSVSPLLSQQLTHQKIKGKFIKLKLSRKPGTAGMIAVSQKQLSGYAFPKFINSYLQKHYR
jgi:A/G-specific adenine glycosylase